MSKLICRNTLTTVGDMISFSTTIDETKHGNSYHGTFKNVLSHCSKQVWALIVLFGTIL